MNQYVVFATQNDINQNRVTIIGIIFRNFVDIFTNMMQNYTHLKMKNVRGAKIFRISPFGEFEIFPEKRTICIFKHCQAIFF